MNNNISFIQPKDAWDALSIPEKAEMMRVAVSHGIYNLKDIRQKYNEFAEGGSIDTDWSYNSWKRQVAEHMGIRPDEDNTYDYEAYFKKYPEEAWKMLKGDPSAHFSDEFKTVYHPTFSSRSIGNDGSIYSGVRNLKTNPQGLVGGTWSPDYHTFTMSPDGYRGPVSMDDRKWYLENAEDNGVVLREADGSLPIYDGIPWGGVLPNVTVTGKKKKALGGNLFGGTSQESQQMNTKKNRLGLTPEQMAAFEASIMNTANLNKGMNTNSNKTVGQVSRDAGIAAVREKNKQEAEKVARYNKHNEIHSIKSIKEISGETVYEGTYDPKVIGLSPVDPIGEFVVATAALNPAFKAAGTLGLYGLGRYGAKMGLGAEQNWARGALLGREFAKAPVTVEGPLFETTAQVRTKLGDVEINNPQLSYRQVGRGAVENFQKTGEQFAPVKTTEADKGTLNYMLDHAMNGVPMYKQGDLWYGLDFQNYPELFTTAEPLAVANKHASIVRDYTTPGRMIRENGEKIQKWDRRAIEQRGRRVPKTEEQLNQSNVSSYIWEPGYGYRRVSAEDTPIIGWIESQKVGPFQFTGYKESPFQMHLKRAEAKGYDISDIKVIDLTKDSPERTEYINSSGLVGSFEEKLRMLIDRINKGGGAGHPEGTRYILHTNPDNLDVKLSHELNHLLHIPDEPVPKGTVYGGWMNIYGDHFKRLNNTDIAARLSQVRDYYGQTGKEPLTEPMLKYAKDHYENDTGIKNGVQEMLRNTGDLRGLAEWGTKHATGLLPFGFMSSYYLNNK